MTTTVSQEEGRLIIRVDESLTIFEAAGTLAELSESAAPELDIHIDIAAGAEVDGAGVQLLLALQREACSNEQSFSMNAADDVSDTLLLAGAARLLLEDAQ